MINTAALDILLHDRRIGTLARLDGDRSIFTFDEAYLADEDRATLSLAYRDPYGGILKAPRRKPSMPCASPLRAFNSNSRH